MTAQFNFDGTASPVYTVKPKRKRKVKPSAVQAAIADIKAKVEAAGEKVPAPKLAKLDPKWQKWAKSAIKRVFTKQVPA